jgi:hypothetical protein
MIACAMAPGAKIRGCRVSARGFAKTGQEFRCRRDLSGKPARPRQIPIKTAISADLGT